MKWFLLLFIVPTLYLLQGCVSGVSSVALSSMSTGAQAAYNHNNLQNTYHDHSLTTQVDFAINRATNIYRNSRVAVSTFNSVVVLIGQVNSSELRDQLMPIAKSVPGVTTVYNLTTVNSPAASLIRVSDAWITTKIKTQLIAANEVDPSQIKVITENGTVYLMGIVFPQQAIIASNIARSTAGVQNVVRVFAYLYISKTMPPTTLG